MKRAAIFALAIAILLAVVVFAPVPGHRRWIGALHDAAHAPVFGCIAVFALAAMRGAVRIKVPGLAAQYLIALIVAVAFGVATELAQLATGRDASIGDARNDLLGALAFLIGFSAFDARLSSRRSVALRAIALVIAATLIAVPSAPVVRAAGKYWQREQRFPVLAQFDRDYDRYFIMQQWSAFEPAQMPSPWARIPQESSLRIRFLPGPYPGMEFIEPSPDWSRYATLALDLTNPTTAELKLVLRVHDARHSYEFDDRFNRELRIAPETRAVVRIALNDVRTAPRTRPMDLRHVAGIILFRSGESDAAEMYFSKLWLE
jgi:hypothetical protein